MKRKEKSLSRSIDGNRKHKNTNRPKVVIQKNLQKLMNLIIQTVTREINIL